jgi:endonuclease YncB( thermonuclease family)
VKAFLTRLIALLLVLLVPTSVSLAQMPPELTEGGKALAAEAIDGDTLRLADGREVRLIGIQAPKLPLGRPGFETWPLAGEAKAALEALAVGKAVVLGYGQAREDRYGRALAHLFVEDSGVWLQGAMLEAGLARVYSFEDNRMLIPEMLAAERAARAARRGLWDHPFYRIRGAEETRALIGNFEMIEGTVADATVHRGLGFINFGPDYRSDFTITLDRAAVAAFRREGVALEDYIGHRIRVRGWLRLWNGPMVEVTPPEQIEVLG